MRNVRQLPSYNIGGTVRHSGEGKIGTATLQRKIVCCCDTANSRLVQIGNKAYIARRRGAPESISVEFPACLPRMDLRATL